MFEQYLEPYSHYFENYSFLINFFRNEVDFSLILMHKFPITKAICFIGVLN